ncbi:hypothetical protein K466DRAFT_605389 [Polyporus arcularius HHB13444]|uniref:Uncharacterized protein n=1 Tax=Polyporus arcularius HHB13444 TaxID=1314778 RepID=A0A5C3NSS1_9APHY|nr:hypothetical protein K466DRAFT_605389 [Polyporus arcularius HHB13444]
MTLNCNELHAFDSWLNRAVREHLRSLLRYDSIDQIPFVSPTLSDDELVAYLHHDMEGPTSRRFRIDFVRPWRTTIYNRAARGVFCHDFVRALGEGQYSPPDPAWVLRATQEQVGEALDSHIRYLRERL